MAKIDLNNIVSGFNLSKINDNFQKIKDVLNGKVLWRDNPEGEPNHMMSDLDMNSKRIYNLPEPIADHEPARKSDVDAIHAITGSKSGLRVGDVDIPELPDAGIRRNKLLSFDNAGNPQVQFPSDDSATQLRIDLAKSTGHNLVGGLVDKVETYADLRNYVKPMDVVDIVGVDIAGRFILVSSGTDNNGTIIVGNDGRKWKRDTQGEVSTIWFKDSSTDAASWINRAANYCRSSGDTLRISPITHNVQTTVDLTGLVVKGSGKSSLIKASSAMSDDVIQVRESATLRDFMVHGGWDGVTAGLTGDAISVVNPVSNWAYNVHMENLIILNAKRNGITLDNGGYSSLRNIKCNASGLHGLAVYGIGGGIGTTTVHVEGTSTFSDCPNGYGAYIKNGIDITISGTIFEYTKGICLDGSDSRNINILSAYQEWTSTAKFLTLLGSGMGLVVQGCFGIGTTIDYSANWYNVDISGNTGFTDSGMNINGRVVTSDSGEVIRNTTGSFGLGYVTLPPGAWRVTATSQMQRIDGASSIENMGLRLASSPTDPAWVVETNGNFVENIDMRATGYTARCRVNSIYINNSNINQNYYANGYLQISAGSAAVRCRILAERI